MKISGITEGGSKLLFPQEQQRRRDALANAGVLQPDLDFAAEVLFSFMLTLNRHDPDDIEKVHGDGDYERGVAVLLAACLFNGALENPRSAPAEPSSAPTS